MAVRLSLAFDTTAESWLNQQVRYDLWRTEQKRASLRVKRLSGDHPVDKVWATLRLERAPAR